MAGDPGRRQAEGHLESRAAAARSGHVLRCRCASSRPATRCWSIRAMWKQKLSGAATVLKATYLHPYQMHGSMGSSCAVADVQGDKATIYSATQAVWYQKSTSAMILGLKPENIHVIFRRGSGCYGVQRRRHGDVRRGGPVAGRRQTGARAAHAQGRDGVGELRQRVRDRSAGCRLMPAGTSSPGITNPGRRAWANVREPTRPGTSSPGSLLGFQPAAFRAAIARPAAGRVQQQQQRRAVLPRRRAPGRCKAAAC